MRDDCSSHWNGSRKRKNVRTNVQAEDTSSMTSRSSPTERVIRSGVSRKRGRGEAGAARAAWKNASEAAGIKALHEERDTRIPRARSDASFSHALPRLPRCVEPGGQSQQTAAVKRNRTAKKLFQTDIVCALTNNVLVFRASKGLQRKVGMQLRREEKNTKIKDQACRRQMSQ